MSATLYAPWRSAYLKRNIDAKCVFCDIVDRRDDKSLGVIWRDRDCFIVMNAYPYTPGHFMIIPHKHTDSLESLDPQVWLRMSALAQQGVELLKDGFGAEGVNLGMNLGRAGGAGIAEHIHLHLVPRFGQDTNFITSVAHTRVYSTDFDKVYEKILSLALEYFTAT